MKKVGKTKAQLEQQVKTLDSILSASSGHIYMYDRNGRYIYVSLAGARALGLKPEDMVGKTWRELNMPAEIMEPFEAKLKEAFTTGKTVTSETVYPTVEGERYYEHALDPVRSTDGSVESVVGTVRDITERKRTEEALKASEASYRNLANSITDVFFAMDENLRYTFWNKASEELTGIAAKDAIGKRLYDIFPDTESTRKAVEAYQTVLRTRQPQHFINQTQLYSKDFVFEISVYPTEAGLSVFVKDITEHKQAEEKTACLSRLYAMLSKTNEAIVRIRELEELYQGICRIAVEDGGFRMVWVGLVDRDSHLVKPVASHGFEDGYLAKIRISIDDVPEGRGPSGTAIREGRYDICNDWEQDPRMNPWRVESAKRGYRSSATFPLRVGTNIIAVLNLYASEPNAFTDEEVQLLDRMVADVSFAIESIEQEKQRKRAEEMLQKSELKYRQLMEQAADGIFVADLEGNLLLVNLMAQKMLGYSEDELCKMNIVETYPPDEIEVARRRLMEMRAGETMHFERQMRRKDGTLFPVEINLRVLEDGNAHGIVRDITERKRAEKSLRALSLRQEAILAAVPEIIMEVDNNKVYTWTNQVGFEFFGEDAIGKEAAFYFEGEQETYNLVQPLFNGAEDIFYVESWQRRKDGQKRLLGWWCRALKDENGNVKGALSSARDITERKQTEEELRKHREHLEELVKERTRELEEKTVELEQANIRLQEIDNLKSVFLASMSHELRTPLNSIIGFSGIMLQGMVGELNEEQRKQLTIVKSSANYLLNLINDVLDISKIEAGRVELSLEKFKLDDVVRDVVQIFSHMAGEKSLELATEVPENVVLFSDKRRVKQVLINLVSNAVKFTDRGTVKIATRVLKGEKLEVRVSDTGIGIKEEDMGRLFEPFQQVDISLRKRYEGTGLGLHLAKMLATLLGGDISAKSRYGQGSEFTFTIPLRYKEG